MEMIQGRTALDINQNEVDARFADFRQIHLDLGTGDGRFVCQMAERHPDRFFIGLDACRENLRTRSQQNLPNILFIAASAHSLPNELDGRITGVTINFPWGSLLTGLLNCDAALLAGLARITHPSASLALHINGDGMRSVGLDLATGTEQLVNTLEQMGWELTAMRFLDAAALRSLCSTWARRLAFGRDPRAVHLSFRKA